MATKKRKTKKAAKTKRVSGRIKKLKSEGVPQKQAVAESLNEERAGKLGKRGGYKRGKKR